MNNLIELENERLDIYEKLRHCPIPENTVTYLEHNNPYYTGSRYRKTNFDDLISLNLHELVPNIPLGEYKQMTHAEIENWIVNTKEYGERVNKEFQAKCDEKMRAIEYAQGHKIRTDKFDVNKVNKLTGVLQLHIMKFLPTETKLTLLEERHKDIKEKMKKWKVKQLKSFYRNVIHEKYVKYTYENYRKKCLSVETFHLSITNKEEYIREIFKVLNMYKNAVPRQLENYYSFKAKATLLFSTIVYANDKILKPNNKSKVEKNIKQPKKKKERITITKEENG
jgi:hypothetical protein